MPELFFHNSGVTITCIKVHAKRIIDVFTLSLLLPAASPVLANVQFQGLATKSQQVIFKTLEVSFQRGPLKPGAGQGVDPRPFLPHVQGEGRGAVRQRAGLGKLPC